MEFRVPTPHEAIADRLVHLIGIAAALAGTAVLIAMGATACQPLEVIALLIYSTSLVAMLVFSAVYNHLRSSNYSELLRRLDNSAIFVLIAGTYTPFTALRLDGAWAIALTALVWVVAAAGVTMRLLTPRLFDRLSVVFYLLFGWIGVIAAKPFIASLQLSTFILLAVGGVLYSVGVIFHVWERLRFQNAIWHGFVVAAAAVHYFAVLDEIAIAHPLG
jgi:hemolysin III